MLRFTIALLCAASLLPAQVDLEKQMLAVLCAYPITAENAAHPLPSDQPLYAVSIPRPPRRPRP